MLSLGVEIEPLLRIAELVVNCMNAVIGAGLLYFSFRELKKKMLAAMAALKKAFGYNKSCKGPLKAA
jgi:hypothetical protein